MEDLRLAAPFVGQGSSAIKAGHDGLIGEHPFSGREIVVFDLTAISVLDFRVGLAERSPRTYNWSSKFPTRRKDAFPSPAAPKIRIMSPSTKWRPAP